MKKSSVEALLLLSTVSSKRELNDFIKDIRSLAAPEVDIILTKLEQHKEVALQTAAEAIGAELEKKKEAHSTAQEIIYLLLTRYKLKVPMAAEQLSKELEQKGISSVLTGSATKPNFSKWIQQLCEEMPREKVMSAALNLGPTQ